MRPICVLLTLAACQGAFSPNDNLTCVDVAASVLRDCNHRTSEPCDMVFDATYRTCRETLTQGDPVCLDPGKWFCKWYARPEMKP